MKRKKIKKEVIENVLPEEIEKVEIKIKKVVTPKKAIIDDVVEVTNMLQTKDVKINEND